MTASVAVIDSGSGNLRSVERALIAAGAKPTLTSDPDAVLRADRIVVPGQGAFADCVSSLAKRGLDEAIREVVAAGKPYLGICLGLQVLFEESDEHGMRQGLGLLKGRVQRFGADAGKVPHMGWNDVHGSDSEPMLRGIPDGTYFYFIHSYYAVPSDPSIISLTSDYGGRFVAAVRKDNLFACQFHPEKSQGAGLKLLSNFMAE